MDEEIKGDSSDDCRLAASTLTLNFDVYAELTDAFDNWLTCLNHAGTRLTSVKVFNGIDITETVHQMHENGLIGSRESYELRCIGNAWMRLMYAYTLHRNGFQNHKRKIISCIFELFSSHLILEDLCVEVCAQL